MGKSLFVVGALFMFGCAALFFGRHYEFGTATHMGPGYLPTLLCWGLVGLGIVILGRGLAVRGPRLTAQRPSFRALE